MRTPQARGVALTSALAGLVTLALALAGCGQVAPGTTAVPPTVSSPSATPSLSPSATPTPSPSPSVPPTTEPPATVTETATSRTPADEPCPAASGVMKSAPGRGKTVALTFDDGPSDWDLQYLAVLNQYRVRATFFETGAHAAANPDVARALAQGGQVVGSHSYDHNYPSAVPGGWTLNYLLDQIDRSDAAISAATGQRVCFYRPPGGYMTNVAEAAAARGLTVVSWSIDTLDWKQPGQDSVPSVDAIVAAATAANGAQHPIVLLHSGKASHESEAKVSSYRGNTLAALPRIIEWYQAHGYVFVGVDGGAA